MHRSIVIFLFLISGSRGFVLPEVHCDVRRWHQIQSTSFHWDENEFDCGGLSDRLRSAYEEWCQTYGENFSSSRMEGFSYHFMVAENYSRRTGVKVKLNQFAGLTNVEIQDFMGEPIDSSRKPLGEDFLDYALEEEASPILTSTETIDPPHQDLPNTSYVSYVEDPIAARTNAYLENMSKDSIVPPPDTNVFEEINVSILEK